MLFRKRHPLSEGGDAVPHAAPGQSGRFPSPGLGRALERVFRGTRPWVLDLGPLCGDTVVHLAERGARVQVEPFTAPSPAPAPEGDAPPPGPEPMTIEQPDDRFDLVLAWEHVDFVPPARIREFGAEIARVVKEGGWVVLFSSARRDVDHGVPARYRVLPEDEVAREVPPGEDRPRWAHPNREIERCLARFSIQGMHLHRNQMREIVALRVNRSGG